MTMTEDVIKILRQDTDGLISYEYLANNIDSISAEDLKLLIENISGISGPLSPGHRPGSL